MAFEIYRGSVLAEDTGPTLSPGFLFTGILWLSTFWTITHHEALPVISEQASQETRALRKTRD